MKESRPRIGSKIITYKNHRIEYHPYYKAWVISYGGRFVHDTPTLKQAKSAVDAELRNHAVKSNPRPRLGTKKPTRVSSATGRAPSKRLVRRRKTNTRKGYFPNPSEVQRAQRYANPVRPLRSAPEKMELRKLYRFYLKRGKNWDELMYGAKALGQQPKNKADALKIANELAAFYNAQVKVVIR